MSVLRRYFDWITWQRVSIAEFKIMRPKREAAIALAYTTVYIVAAGIISYVITLKPLPILGSANFTTDAWYALVFKIGLLLILPAGWFFGQGYRVRDLLPGWRIQFKTATSIIIAFVVGLSLNLGRLDLIKEAVARFSTGDMMIRVGIGLVLPLLMAGIPEELVYRGILQTRVERALGRIPAIILTAMLFTAWHLPSRFLLAQGVEGSAGDIGSILRGTGIPVFIVGVIFSMFWDRHRSLLPLIAAHWGIDILPTIASLVGVQY